MWSHGKGEHGSSCHPRSNPVDCWITCIAETGIQVEQTVSIKQTIVRPCLYQQPN